MGKDSTKIDFKDINSEDRDLAKVAIEHQVDQEKAGYFGKVFGLGAHATNNIVGFIASLLILGGFLFMGAVFLSDQNKFGENMPTVLSFWEKILPVVTAIVGYLFGKGTK